MIDTNEKYSIKNIMHIIINGFFKFDNFKEHKLYENKEGLFYIKEINKEEK